MNENGKEYFIEFDKNGIEIPKSRKRKFEGIRLMIIGCENVGKVCFIFIYLFFNYNFT